MHCLSFLHTLDDSHHTATTEIVKESIEDSNEMKIWDQPMYL